MKLIIEKQTDGGIYAYMMSNKAYANSDPEDDAKVPRLNPHFLNENCNLYDMDVGYIVFDIKNPYKKKKKKKKKKKQPNLRSILKVNGRHITQLPGPLELPVGTPHKFVAQLYHYATHSTIRVDDENHPEFWLEIILDKD